MLYHQHKVQVLLLTTITVMVALVPTSTGLPPKAIESPDPCAGQSEDDCLDLRMHPDLSTTSSNRKPRRGINLEETNEYWLQKGIDHIRQQKRTQTNKFNTRVAKNVILFLGDGMGLPTLAAARNLLGGEEEQLSFEKFPFTGLSKTYSVNTIVPDSAVTSTAYLCGVKGNHGTIGVNGEVKRSDCSAMADTDDHVYSIAKWAMDAGKSAGFVTTTRVTHASPAGVYAHTADREWENDALLKEECGDNSDLPDIALQLIHGDVGRNLKVMMGGGRRNFIDSSLSSKGKRSDGRNLIEEYLDMSERNAYVETKDELDDLNLDRYDRLLGLFKNSHMDYHVDMEDDPDNTQPTLEEMTKKAIEFLEKDGNGYFLFVEGGKIDVAHHDTLARIALDETLEFSKAVEMAREMTSEEDTLIVVTADHSHTFSLSGYQDRGSDIFDVAPNTADDDRNYLSLSYANGPSFEAHFNVEKNRRRKPENVMTGDPYDEFPVTVPLDSETHGGEDVAVFASGPWENLFTGVYEENAIPHMMAYAACIGDGLKAC